jgi:hypothetical protein
VRNGTGDAEKQNREGRASGGDGLTGDGTLVGGKPGARVESSWAQGGANGLNSLFSEDLLPWNLGRAPGYSPGSPGPMSATVSEYGDLSILQD